MRGAASSDMREPASLAERLSDSVSTASLAMPRRASLGCQVEECLMECLRCCNQSHSSAARRALVFLPSKAPAARGSCSAGRARLIARLEHADGAAAPLLLHISTRASGSIAVGG